MERQDISLEIPKDIAKFRELLDHLLKTNEEQMKFYLGVYSESLRYKAQDLTSEDIKSVINLDIVSFKRSHDSIFYTYIENGKEKECKINIYELILKLAGVKL